MAKNLYDLRFGIRRKDGYISSIWRLWITDLGDVYLTTSRMGGIEKYSFHKSGICRSAFTKEHGTPATMSDRALFKWDRLKTPEQHSGRASRVAWIAFPTDYLSRNKEDHKKKVTWIDAAPSGGATYLELAYTSESEESVLRAYSVENVRHLVSCTLLPTQETFLVSYYYDDWENKDLRSPAGKESVFPNLLFSENDPKETGRPVRIRFGPTPKYGDALVLQELGGYEESCLKS